MSAFPPSANATYIPPPMDPMTIPPPPPGLNYIAAIKPMLIMYTISSVGAAILVPCMFALFFFSTKHMRRTPIFIANVLSVCVGLAMGILYSVVTFRAIVAPTAHVASSFFIAGGSLISSVPFIVESILVLRLIAVYPIRRDTMRRSIFIFVPLLMLKIGRLVNTSIYLSYYAKVVKTTGNPMVAGQLSWRSHPGERIEWVLQVVDNTSASLLFLYVLWDARRKAKQNGGIPSSGARKTFFSRMSTLFWIAASNFVFPVILSIIQLIFTFVDGSFERGTCVFLVNDFVDIVGVLLATVWVSGSHWGPDGIDPVLSKPATHFPSIRFHHDINTINITHSVRSEAHGVDGVGLKTFSDDYHRSVEDGDCGLASKEGNDMNLSRENL